MEKPNGETFRDAVFVKSTFSAANGDCVEVAHQAGLIGIRDSKNPKGPVLVFTASEWDAFCRGMNEGQFI